MIALFRYEIILISSFLLLIGTAQRTLAKEEVSFNQKEEIAFISEQLSDSISRLKHTYNSTTTPEIYFQTAIDLFWVFQKFDLDSAYSFVKIALDSIDKVKYKKWHHNLLVCEAGYFSELGKFKESLKSLQYSLQLAQQLSPHELAISNLALGQLLRKMNASRQSLKYLLSVEKYALETNNEWFLAKSKHELGMISRQMQNYDEAISFLKDAISIFDGIENDISRPYSILALANTYIDIKQYDSAISILLPNSKLLQQCKPSRAALDNYVLLSKAHDLAQFSDKASLYYDSTYAYARAIYPGNAKLYSGFLLEYSKFIMRKGRHEAALNILLEIDTSAIIYEQKAELFFILSDLSQLKGDLENALVFKDKAYQFLIKQNDEVEKDDINSLSLIYRLENEILESKLNGEQKLTKYQKKIQYFLYALLVFMLFSFIYVWFLYRKNKKTAYLLKKSNVRINKQQFKLKQNNKELQTINNKLGLINAEKDSMIKIITHDLKAPLNRIAGLVNILELSLKSNDQDESKRYIKLIRQVIEEGGNTVLRLLDIKSIEEGDIKLNIDTIPVKTFLTQLKTEFLPLATEKDLDISVDVEDEDLVLETDKHYLSIIFQNLLSNAIKFCYKHKQIILHAFQKDDFVYIEVIDFGPGIRKEEEHLLFQKFQRLSSRPTGTESSTGLGLAIVKSLSTKLGGDVRYNRVPDGGSIFSVRLATSPTKQQQFVQSSATITEYDSVVR